MDADLSPSATIMYVNSTQLFMSNGTLQVGREVIQYGRKLEDRFLDLKRGIGNTLPQQHFAGDYFRELGKEVRVIEAGPRTIVTTSEVSRSEYVETTLTAQVQVIAEPTLPVLQINQNLKLKPSRNSLHYSTQEDGQITKGTIAERVVTLTEKSVASSAESVSAGVNILQSITDVKHPSKN